MNKLFIFIFIILFSNKIFSSENKIQWASSYQETIKTAQEKHKPIFLLFTNPKACYWCQKLQKEILEDSDFNTILNEKCVFFLANFGKELSHEELKEYRELMNQFQIEWFPTIVILNQNLQILSTFGYMPIGGKKFAQSIAEFLENRISFFKDEEKCRCLVKIHR